MVSIGTKNVPSKQGLGRFLINSGHTLNLRMFSWSQFLAFVMHCIKVRSHFPSSLIHLKTFFLTIVHINLGVTTNLRNKGLSVSQVEDWKVTIPSFDLFPTVPLTFDEVYWEAYWGIVNKPASVVRDVMIKLERETWEKEMMAMNKQKLEQDAQKQQEKLVLRKKRRIIESPTQSPLPKSTENTPEKNNSLDNSEQPQYMHNNLEEVRLKKRKKLSNHPLHGHHPTHLILPLLL